MIEHRIVTAITTESNTRESSSDHTHKETQNLVRLVCTCGEMFPAPHEPDHMAWNLAHIVDAARKHVASQGSLT